jgi:hypothetical protein
MAKRMSCACDMCLGTSTPLSFSICSMMWTSVACSSASLATGLASRRGSALVAGDSSAEAGDELRARAPSLLLACGRKAFSATRSHVLTGLVCRRRLHTLA